MKKIVRFIGKAQIAHLLLMILGLCSGLYAQNNTLPVAFIYDEVFIASASHPDGIRSVQKLLIIGNTGLSYTPLDSAKSKAGSVFKEHKSDSLFSIEKNHYAKGVVYIRESSKAPVWRLAAGDSVIGGYICKKALTTTRGRNYTVWYTMQIPASYGPWKLYGLPGLIVHVKDSKGEIEVKLYKVIINQFHQPFPRPFPNHNIKYILLHEYEPIIAQNYKNAMMVAESSADGNPALMRLKQDKGSVSFSRRIIDFEFDPKLSYVIQYK